MKKKGILILILTVMLVVLGVLGFGIINSHFFFKDKFVEPKYIEKTSKEELQYILDNFDMSQVEVRKIPTDVLTYSKKLHLFDNIYYAKKPVLVYGYEKKTDIEYISENFHKKIQRDIFKKGFNKKYEVVTISKPEATVNAVIKSFKVEIPDEEMSSCELMDSDLKGIMAIVETTAGCYSGVCIVNPSKKEYIVLPKKYPELILKVLEEYK